MQGVERFDSSATQTLRLRSLTDKTSGFEPEYCRFKSYRGRDIISL